MSGTPWFPAEKRNPCQERGIFEGNLRLVPALCRWLLQDRFPARGVRVLRDLMELLILKLVHLV